MKKIELTYERYKRGHKSNFFNDKNLIYVYLTVDGERHEYGELDKNDAGNWTLYGFPSWDFEKKDFIFDGCYMDFEGAEFYPSLKETKEAIEYQVKNLYRYNRF